MRSRIVFLLLFGAVFFRAHAGDDAQRLIGKDRRLYQKAERQLMFSDYEKALPLYLEVLSHHPDNARANYRVGLCYYYTSDGKLKSPAYFEKALKCSAGGDTLPDLLYYAGMAFQFENHFDDALHCFERLEKKFPSQEGVLDLQRLITTCKNGKAFMADSINAVVENLGANINSPYPDYAPIVTNDESMLIFTSKRKGNTGGRLDDMGEYYEDVYMSHGRSENWAAASRYDSSYHSRRGLRRLFARAENVSEINTADHDGAVCLSPDGKRLYIFRYSDVWSADWNGKSWSSPVRLNETIDKSSSHEPSLCLSPDGNTMFLVSDRKGGNGGKDIYRCTHNSDGTWSAPENLGDVINTEYDEDAPYLMPDGKTLYFSSVGHNSMGGYDVFRSVLDNGKWSTPENLGYPLNSGGDDVFYTPIGESKRAYYASMRPGSNGDLDIYSVEVLPWDHNLMIKPVFAYTTNPIKMLLTNTRTGKDTTMELMANQQVSIKFEPGTTYNVTIDAPGYKTARTSYTFASDKRLNNCYQEIRFKKLDDGQEIQLWNAFFDMDRAIEKEPAFMVTGDYPRRYTLKLNTLDTVNKRPGFDIITLRDRQPKKDTTADTFAFDPIQFDFDKSDVNGEAKAALDKVVQYMAKHTDIKFDVAGFTDSKGSDAYNLALSQRRAQAAKNYLVQHGIDAKRITAIGKGEASPIARNENADGSDNPEGRQKNRRVEIIFHR